jgi:hypothetical protein
MPFVPQMSLLKSIKLAVVCQFHTERNSIVQGAVATTMGNKSIIEGCGVIKTL